MITEQIEGAVILSARCVEGNQNGILKVRSIKAGAKKRTSCRYEIQLVRETENSLYQIGALRQTNRSRWRRILLR